MAAPAPPDPTIDLHWGEFRGAIHDIFAANAKSFADRECVVETKSSQGKERSFTYRQINEAANRLAHHLLAHGCQIGDVAMIYAYRGVDLVVAYMGALKAGATVSVIDPQYPAERQKVLLDIARPRFLVCIDKANRESGPLSAPVLEFVQTTLDLKSFIPALQLCDNGELRGGVPANATDGKDALDPETYSSEDPVGVDVGPEAAPTLSYTSGSEGRPKGVLGRHFSLTHYFPWMAKEFGLSDQDRFTMLSGIAHDPIQRDIFTPLFLGAKIIIPPVEVIAYELLAEWMKESKVTVTHLTPAMGQILVGGATARIGALRNAFFVGDQLTKKDTTKLRNLANGANIINLYGSTESQRAVSFIKIPSKNEDPDILDSFPDIIPVGQGMQNVQLLVVDRDDPKRLCDIGEQGELFLRAGGLARGYLGDDEKTKELNRSKFVPNWFVDNPEPRDRLYKTGDLGRRRPDGSVECTGRIDSQVKIRGFRIELGEIDAHLSQHPYLRENVTLVRRDKNEEHTLVTYFVPETKRWFQHLEELEAQGATRSRTSRAQLDVQSPDESIGQMLLRFRSLSEDAKKFLSGRLPSYAVPSLFIPLARMPLNPNGKIDRAALPFPDETDLAFLAKRRASSVAPKLTDTQQRLAAIWASVIPNCFARTLRPESNFFDEGGHSILAQQMFFRLTKEWKDIDVPMRAIFQHQTLEALAAEIDRAQDPIGLRLDAVPLESDANAEDEAYAVDARELTNQLAPNIPAAPATTEGAPTVLLTGATGFLGSYIVHELIEGPTKSNVIALVRAKDTTEGMARLESVMKAYGLWSPAWLTASPTPRIQVVVGDFAKPQFGLTEDVWTQLSNTVDAVIHNGAQVNWMLPYSVLRAANVLSTLTCIQLCASGNKAKRLAFVSSTSAVDNDHFVHSAAGPKGTPILETDDLSGSRKGLATGYGQSKWASEYLLREAGRRGLVGAIIRSGYITGDPATGTSVTDDFLVRLWKGCIQVGARPDISNTLNAVPVTQVNRIVVSAAFHLPDASNGVSLAVAQVTGHPRPTLNDWMSAIEVYGYAAPLVPYADWAAKVKAYVDDEANAAPDREHALLPLFHMVVNDLPGNSLAPELDDRQTQAALKLYDAKSQPSDNSVPIPTMGSYLAYLVAAGFLPAPPAGAATPLPQLSAAALANISAGQLGGRSAAK